MSRAQRTYLDYAACVHCTELGSFGKDYEKDYCAREFPFADEPEQVRPLPHERYMLGCERFTWNGMPVHRKAHEEIRAAKEYAASPLRILAGEGVVCDLTFNQLTRNNGYGSSFRK